MQNTFMRIPYTGPLPPPVIVPKYADTPAGAVAALIRFLSAPTTRQLPKPFGSIKNQTVLLTGAGVSVASGLADYRGSAGTYTLNKMYRPIYYNEFITNHEARKRYWARSFMGWTSLHRARPNAAHWAIRDIGGMGLISHVITQSTPYPCHPIAALAPYDAENPVIQMSTLSTPLPIQNYPLWNYMATFGPSSAFNVKIIFHETSFSNP